MNKNLLGIFPNLKNQNGSSSISINDNIKNRNNKIIYPKKKKINYIKPKIKEEPQIEIIELKKEPIKTIIKIKEEKTNFKHPIKKINKKPKIKKKKQIKYKNLNKIPQKRLNVMFEKNIKLIKKGQKYYIDNYCPKTAFKNLYIKQSKYVIKFCRAIKKQNKNINKIIKESLIEKETNKEIVFKYHLWNIYELKIFKRVKKSLSDNYTRSKLQKLGRVKGFIHNNWANHISDNFIVFITDILKENKINYNSLRDYSRMKKYRLNNPMCEKCHINKTKHCHHIISPKDGGLEINDNYLAVCIPCHKSFHPELPEGFIS